MPPISKGSLVLVTLVALFALGCRAGPDVDPAPTEDCTSYLTSYAHCLRKTGLPAEQVTSRLAIARESMFRSADAGEASVVALKAKCVHATQQMERSCR